MERGDSKVVSIEPRKKGTRFSRVPSHASELRLSAETLRVLIALGRHANNESGHCYPGLDLLAEEARVLRKNLHRNFRHLVSAGLLRLNSDGSYTVLYELCPEPARRLDPEPARLNAETDRLNAETDRLNAEPALYIEEQPNKPPSGTAHSTARVRAGEGAVEVLSPIEVERSDRFELLWLEYPSRPDDPKELGRRAFDELIAKGINPNSLIDAAVRYGNWARRDAPGGAYVPHMHRWLREGRYQHDGKSWPRPRQSIVGIMADLIESGPLGVGENQSDNSSARPAPVFWSDRLEQLDRTGIWAAEWGPPPDDPRCQLPARFRSKLCVRRWLEHAENIRNASTDG